SRGGRGLSRSLAPRVAVHDAMPPERTADLHVELIRLGANVATSPLARGVLLPGVEFLACGVDASQGLLFHQPRPVKVRVSSEGSLTQPPATPLNGISVGGLRVDVELLLPTKDLLGSWRQWRVCELRVSDCDAPPG